MLSGKTMMKSAAILCLIGGVASIHEPIGAGAAEARRAPVITRLVGRDWSIIVTASARGPLYSATDRDGKIIAQNLSLDELQAAHPLLYQRLQPAWAGLDKD